MVLFGPVAESQSTGICQYCVEVHEFSIPAVELKQVDALCQKKGDPCVPGAVRAPACEGTIATDAKAHIPNTAFFMTPSLHVLGTTDHAPGGRWSRVVSDTPFAATVIRDVVGHC